MREHEGAVLQPQASPEDILDRFVIRAQADIDTNVAGEDRKDDDAGLHLVTFRLGREEYGVEIDRVQEIIRAADITTVPGAPSHVRGVINLRGKIIPVVDTRKRFGLQATQLDEDQRIVVVELGVKRLGLLVDSVSRVTRVPVSSVEDLPEEMVSDDNYIRGMCKLADSLIMLLDFNQTLMAVAR
jgi:purine-binding chemotaxis protein CheW